MDALGHHLIQCWQHRTVPHDGLCRKLHGLCRSAGLDARLEPTNCLTHQDPGSERRPDIAVEGLASGGRVLLLDATTADPSAVSTLNTFKSHRTEGAAASAGERRKLAEYQGHFGVNSTSNRWRLSSRGDGEMTSMVSLMPCVKRRGRCTG